MPGDCMYYTYAHMEVRRLSPPAWCGGFASERASERVNGGASDERERERAVITFYFKDGRGSFAILCRTSICLIYRNYTYTDPVRFCHNLYPEYRRTRASDCFPCVYTVSRDRSLSLVIGSRRMRLLRRWCDSGIRVAIDRGSKNLSEINPELWRFYFPIDSNNFAISWM